MTEVPEVVTVEIVDELEEPEAIRLCRTGADDAARTAFRGIYDRHFD